MVQRPSPMSENNTGQNDLSRMLAYRCIGGATFHSAKGALLSDLSELSKMA